ncbi:hypothetical protein GMDG_00649 [Pseudogymnoascus destructans 20631-21]|uniref:DDE Tnp4 domain-containing protein n=1 Tax=Pseudogymnoascus destructans (strain ATCC MYA-4855 / 20631-21) TaxID=658429 RepID=L8G8Q1_PSED2|nr:hypothetical protein GMDG_00649 [Pseudogymnoascus destructans 20631-21]
MEQELCQLISLLHMEEMTWRSHLALTPEDALCVICAILAYPGRWVSLCHVFGWSEAWLSTVFNDTVLFLAAQFGLTLWWHHQLTYHRLAEFAAGVKRVCGVGGVWGFVDSTFCPHCHPQGNVAQRAMFSGHKRLYGVNWQTISTPDVLISSLMGPFAGPVNDWAMWYKSGYDAAIRKIIEGHETLYVFGDPAYSAAFGTVSRLSIRLGSLACLRTSSDGTLLCPLLGLRSRESLALSSKAGHILPSARG